MPSLGVGLRVSHSAGPPGIGIKIRSHPVRGAGWARPRRRSPALSPVASGTAGEPGLRSCHQETPEAASAPWGRSLALLTCRPPRVQADPESESPMQHQPDSEMLARSGAEILVATPNGPRSGRSPATGAQSGDGERASRAHRTPPTGSRASWAGSQRVRHGVSVPPNGPTCSSPTPGPPTWRSSINVVSQPGPRSWTSGAGQGTPFGWQPTEGPRSVVLTPPSRCCGSLRRALRTRTSGSVTWTRCPGTTTRSTW